MNGHVKFAMQISRENFRSVVPIATNSCFSSIIYLLLLFLSFPLSLFLFPSHRRACELPSRVSGVFIFRFVPLSFNKNRIHFERRWEWIYVYTQKLVMQCRILMPLFILDPAWTDTNISVHDSFSLSSLFFFFFFLYLLTILSTVHGVHVRPLVLSSSNRFIHSSLP